MQKLITCNKVFFLPIIIASKISPTYICVLFPSIVTEEEENTIELKMKKKMIEIQNFNKT